ncbi:hypothetical protein AK88_01369 [Plasmodium fragile]|uniref:Schizont-infected cell agglutination C-terminal domain-containing protein n=1 Tax=Plasmodium fragile TaxID=5857 RepID=A0A0D9QP53_PLAFR|nr:uncharacterized protein AK88_01369 [Plasmodium fragile]KJP88875.1 hypothetical protein AK88_01369 [Plasmodium fragile]
MHAACSIHHTALFPLSFEIIGSSPTQDPKTTESKETTAVQSPQGEPGTAALPPGPLSPDPISTSTQTPSTEQTGASGAAGPQGPSGPPGAKGEEGKPADGVVDAGNDDPPPLNPPKPKPETTNPHQARSSVGSGSPGGVQDPGSTAGSSENGGGGLPDGAGGGGGGASSSSSPSEPSSSAQGTEITTTTTITQTPSSETLSPTSPQSPVQPSPPKAGDDAVAHFVPPPSKPCDPKDLIPYTPAIIPAVVGIGVIAFFLWKKDVTRERRNNIDKQRCTRSVAVPNGHSTFRSIKMTAKDKKSTWPKCKYITELLERAYDDVEEPYEETYEDIEQTYEGAYEDVEEPYEETYEDVEEPYEETYEDADEGVYSDEQWEEAGEEDDYEEQEEEAILGQWKPEQQAVPQEVHYDGEWNIKHDARKEEVDESDTLSAAASITESTESVVQAMEQDAEYKTESFTGETKVP